MELGTPLQLTGRCIFDNSRSDSITYSHDCKIRENNNTCEGIFYDDRLSLTYEGIEGSNQTLDIAGKLVDTYQAKD